jgi:hypothetical protein
MKEMNSETHSWTVSLESFAILAFSGRVFFMMRAIFAIGRYRSFQRNRIYSVSRRIFRQLDL